MKKTCSSSGCKNPATRLRESIPVCEDCFAKVYKDAKKLVEEMFK